MTTLTADHAADLFRSAPDRMLDVEAGSAAYRRVGSGPDVLFVHGWPVSGATFRKLLPYLADEVTCHIIDFPSAGSSEFDSSTTMTMHQHIETVRRVVDLLEFESVAVVGHDSGGLIARHAMVDDPRLRAMGLINTEPLDPGWRFRSFVAAGGLPGFGRALAWAASRPRLRKSRLVLGDAFSDSSLLDGEFDEFFLRPIAESDAHRVAATKLIRSFDMADVAALPGIHERLNVPVRLVWGADDPFFPVDRARAMVSSFPDASIEVIEKAGLFSHEERPAEVAAALLPVLAT